MMPRNARAGLTPTEHPLTAPLPEKDGLYHLRLGDKGWGLVPSRVGYAPPVAWQPLLVSQQDESLSQPEIALESGS